jgi:hypothetical protein
MRRKKVCLHAPPLDFIRQVLSPDGGQRAEATRGLDVADDANHDNRRGLDDGDGFHNFLLVILGTRSLQFSDDVGHASLVTEESCQMNWLLGVVLRLIVSFLALL